MMRGCRPSGAVARILELEEKRDAPLSSARAARLEPLLQALHARHQRGVLLLQRRQVLLLRELLLRLRLRLRLRRLRE